MTILEIEKPLVDRMHIEDALFQAINSINGVKSFNALRGGVRINSSVIPISDKKDVYAVDLLDTNNPEEIANKLNVVMGGGRIFPNSYGQDIPLDNITPTSVDRYVPSDAEAFYKEYGFWIQACVEETVSCDKETGFMQDSMDNIVGITVGDIDKIRWPASIIDRHGLRFHTHPQEGFLADPSLADLELLKKTKGEVAADAIVSTFGRNDVYSLSYVLKRKNKSARPNKCVDRYVDSMIDMAVNELQITKQLAENGEINLERDIFKDTTIKDLAEFRVANEQKLDMIREIAGGGYKVEVSWEIIDRR